MSNNVLDKSAMATLARLEHELPHIAEALTDLHEGQEKMRREHQKCTSAISGLCCWTERR